MQSECRIVPRVFAVEYIRRMRGGSQSQLLRCSDGRYYVVKFQRNPQGTKVLANELLATLIAKMLGLPVSEPAIVEVHPNVVRYSEGLVIEYKHGRVPCCPGLCFGSLYGNGESSLASLDNRYDLCPESLLHQVQNLSDFLGMLVFDKWIGNTDPRQTIFIRNDSFYCPYRVLMIDQGLSFNGAEWNFPDFRKLGLYRDRTVYASVSGIEAFDPWLYRLDRCVNRDRLDQAAKEIPAEWYRIEFDSLNRLLDRLDERRNKVRALLLSARKAAPEFFPSWRCPEKSLPSYSGRQRELSVLPGILCGRKSTSGC